MLKQAALKALDARKKANKNKKRIDNASLPAGSPMYFYCRECGDESDVLPESYIGTPKRYCRPCQDLKDSGVIV